MAAEQLEKSFTAEACYCNFYTGGDVYWSKDGSHMYCLNNSEVAAVDISTGQIAHSFSNQSHNTVPKDDFEEDDVIYTFALSPNSELVVTAHRSGLLRLWSLETHTVTKLWKAQHHGPIVKVQFSACNKLVCTSGADSTLRLWDFVNGRCINVLKDFNGPTTLLHFHPNIYKTEVLAAGADNVVYYWDYVAKKQLAQLRGHMSQITGVSFENSAENCKHLATVSRDKVLIIWQLEGFTQLKVIPLFEELEGAFFLNNHDNISSVVVACLNGSLKLVDYTAAKITPFIDCTNYAIKGLLHCEARKQLAVVTTEDNILLYSTTDVKRQECIKQLIGFNDEILDICFIGSEDRFLAMATNSKNIKMYDTQSDMNCQIVGGHKDTILSLSSSGDFLLSAGKDCSIFLWKLDAATSTLHCVAKNLSSHISIIGAVSFGFNNFKDFASVCQDGTLKVWKVHTDSSETYTFQVKYSAIAHDKEINAVTYAPNNKMLATASQDKTAKLWVADRSLIVGTLRGHTRGVWCVRFSPVDQIVLTASSDCTMRLWSLATMACLKRFEQDCTILRAEFIDHGKYILSAATNGLIKVWNIKRNACITTLDEHKDRIWSVAVSMQSNQCFFSGGADSKLIKWRDNTEEIRSSATAQQQEFHQQEQLLQSLLHQQRGLQKAFNLALKLGKPKTTYEIASILVRQHKMTDLRKVISELNDDGRGKLLEHVKAWSTNSRHSKIANIILRQILNEILANPNESALKHKNSVEVLTPYVQRHFNRATELSKQLTFLDFVVKCI